MLKSGNHSALVAMIGAAGIIFVGSVNFPFRGVVAGIALSFMIFGAMKWVESVEDRVEALQKRLA